MQKEKKERKTKYKLHVSSPAPKRSSLLLRVCMCVWPNNAIDNMLRICMCTPVTMRVCQSVCLRVCNLGIVKAGQVTNLISSGVCPVVFFIHRNLCEGHESEKETWFGDRKRTAIVIWAWIESADRHSDRTMVINSLLTNCGGFTFWLRFLLGTARTLRCYRHAGFHQGLHHPHITLYTYNT